MIDVASYLRLLPKAELHCHFVSTMRATTLVELCRQEGVPLRTDDLDALFVYDGLPDFLDLFNAAHAALRTPAAIARVAYEGVQDAVAAGNLRYREYFINPDNFSGLDYPTLIAAMIEGLSRAERELGVGFTIVAAINRSLGPDTAVRLVETMIAHPFPEVVGIGQDDLTPELTEDPLRFRDAYALAKRHGYRVSAHVGETMNARPEDVIDAIEGLGLDRVDHGYRCVDDPEVLGRVQEVGLPFTCTPHSTRMLSGWDFTPEHRIARMVQAGLPVTLATDDAVFFRTDIGQEYAALVPMGLTARDAAAIARNGFAAAWCPPEQRRRMLADTEAAIIALDAALDAALSTA